MNKSYFKSVLLLLIVLVPFKTFSQDTLNDTRTYSRLSMENPWLSSNNIAGNAFSSFIPDGIFELNSSIGKGDLKLSQLSPEERNYSFNADKFIRLENITFYGGVNYLNQQQESVGWTARMNPVTNNPYMLADSIYGLYSKDYVNLFGSFAYSFKEKLVFGIDVDYLVGDGARIKDPRSVNDLFSLEILPSVIYSFPEWKIGANLQLIKGREKIYYTTIENSTTYRFFRFFGLGKGAKTINGWSYTRNYYNSGIGGELQSEYKIGNLNLFSGIGYLSTEESSEDGSYNPRKDDAGNYKESVFNFYTILSAKNSLVHYGKIYANLSIGEGIEFIQEPYLENSITYYRTVAEVSKYSLFSLNPGIKYKLAKPYNNYSNTWELEVNAEFDMKKLEYLLEAEQSISNIISSLSFDRSFFFTKNQIVLGLNGSYLYNLNKELKQLRTYSALQDIAAWQYVVYPDYTILSSNTYSIAAHFRYGRYVNIIKDKTSLAYFDFVANYSEASNEVWSGNKTWEFYGIKLGITY